MLALIPAPLGGSLDLLARALVFVVFTAGALAALDRMYLTQGKWNELADILRRELAATTADDARGGLLLRLGILTQDKLGVAADAVELYRQVLEVDATNEEARRRLEGWLGDDGLKLTVATILLPVYERLQAWPQVVQCLEIQVAAADSVGARVELLLQIGAILAQTIGNSAAAFDAYSRAFKQDPHNETAQAELEKIAHIEDRFADFAALYEEAVAGDLPSELQKNLLMKLAALYDQRLGNGAKAIESYKKAVEVDADNVAALDALEKLYNRDQNWADLLGVYRSKVGLTSEPAGRQDLRFRIAYLQDEMLEQKDAAIATYNEILADEFENLQAIVALDRLYLAGGNWALLAENLERQLTLSHDPLQQVDLNRAARMRMHAHRRGVHQAIGSAQRFGHVVAGRHPPRGRQLRAFRQQRGGPPRQGRQSRGPSPPRRLSRRERSCRRRTRYPDRWIGRNQGC